MIRHLLKRLILSVLLATAAFARAAQPDMAPVTPPGFLPTGLARPLLDQDPGVVAARAGLEVAQQEANILDSSTYEWTTKANGQRRRLDSGPRYNEWNVGIERPLRLPGKAAADRRIGQSTIEESQARYGEALHEAARELMNLWVDWLGAERASELAADSLQATQSSLVAVEKRLRAGDASKLDASVARAELAEQRRLHNDAKTQALAGWMRLSTRFPGIGQQAISLPSPLPIVQDGRAWRERILDENDELKALQAQLRIAEGRFDRARAERTPDPTVGVHTGSDIGGRERYTGVTISIPIPGGARSANSARAQAAAEMAGKDVELRRRQLDAQVASALTIAQGAYESLQIANEGAAAMRENAELMQRAYALGEAELQALLLARRQQSAAMSNALQAQLTALKAYYGLLIDAHLVWDLEHD